MVDAVMGDVGIKEGNLAARSGLATIRVVECELRNPGGIESVLGGKAGNDPLAEEEARLAAQLEEVRRCRERRSGQKV